MVIHVLDDDHSRYKPGNDNRDLYHLSNLREQSSNAGRPLIGLHLCSSTERVGLSTRNLIQEKTGHPGKKE